MPATRYQEMQQALGLTHHPHGVLLDETLDAVFDPIAVFHHDWMQGLFVDGCFNLAIYLLFEAFIQAGHRNVYEMFSNYAPNFGTRTDIRTLKYSDMS